MQQFAAETATVSGETKTGGTVELIEERQGRHRAALSSQRDEDARLDLGGKYRNRVEGWILGNAPNGDTVLPCSGGRRQAIQPQPTWHAQRKDKRDSNVVECLHQLPGDADRQPAQRAAFAQAICRGASADFSILVRANSTASAWLRFNAIHSTV